MSNNSEHDAGLFVFFPLYQFVRSVSTELLEIVLFLFFTMKALFFCQQHRNCQPVSQASAGDFLSLTEWDDEKLARREADSRDGGLSLNSILRHGRIFGKIFLKKVDKDVVQEKQGLSLLVPLLLTQ